MIYRAVAAAVLPSAAAEALGRRRRRRPAFFAPQRRGLSERGPRTRGSATMRSESPPTSVFPPRWRRRSRRPAPPTSGSRAEPTESAFDGPCPGAMEHERPPAVLLPPSCLRTMPWRLAVPVWRCRASAACTWRLPSRCPGERMSEPDSTPRSPPPTIDLKAEEIGGPKVFRPRHRLTSSGSRSVPSRLPRSSPRSGLPVSLPVHQTGERPRHRRSAGCPERATAPRYSARLDKISAGAGCATLR